MKMAKQNWNIGQTVKIGFVAGLEVLQKIATPGDYMPDLYVLRQQGTGRIYRFVPHNGLSRCGSVAEACEW
jgi:hypothetical protein